MGFARALEALHALLYAYPSGRNLLLPADSDALPYPHLQQRLQQTVRAVSLTAVAAVAIPLAVLTLAPMASPWEFPGLVGFSLLCVLLAVLSLVQLTVRYVLLPAPRPTIVQDPLAVMQGLTQTVVCAVVDMAAQLYREPQLLMLVVLCVVHTWTWKNVLYYSVAIPSEAIAGDFSLFVVVGGLVTFLSWLAVETRLDQDPFVLDPRSSFVSALQRDVVRAVRRAVLVYTLTRVVLLVTGSSFSVSGVLAQLFTIDVSRMYFHVTTSVLENFVALSSASVFRILLFRPSYAIVSNAGTKLWDVVDAQTKTRSGVEALFESKVDVAVDGVAPLDEQYVTALQKRVDAAMQAIAARKVPVARASQAFGSDKCVEDLNVFFALENLLLASKFSAANRKSLYASHKRWHSLFRASTAAIDSFTVSLRLLNTIPSRKNQNAAAVADAQALEQSVPQLFKFLIARADVDPLLLLEQNPHLSNLRISSAGFKSTIRYVVESRIQFAARRFLMQEAKRQVFRASHVRSLSQWDACGCLLCFLRGTLVATGCSSCSGFAVPSRQHVTGGGRTRKRQGTGVLVTSNFLECG